MKTLHLFDDHNYELTWKRINREAVRAVIVRDGFIALVKSLKEGFYKFPGGGIEAGENHSQTLIRETLEETGLHVLPATIKELGMLHEIRKGLYGDEIFDQKSYYYYADVRDELSIQNLSEYEKEQSFTLEWIDIQTALSVNRSLGRNYETSFILREAYLLQYILRSRKPV